jgi:hypothetical protein
MVCQQPKEAFGSRWPIRLGWEDLLASREDAKVRRETGYRNFLRIGRPRSNARASTYRFEYQPVCASHTKSTGYSIMNQKFTSLQIAELLRVN